jgi:non-homologous end joining protein Ku
MRSLKDIVKGYKVDTFIEVTKEEFENVTLESTRTAPRQAPFMRA